MNKKWILNVCVVLLAINLVLTGLLVCGVLPMAKENAALTPRYTLYIGTNDKDTNAPLISIEDAMEIVNEICTRHVTGYTAAIGHGGWKNDVGEYIQEDSLIYTFIDAQEEDVLKIKDEAMEALNQQSILLEFQEITSTYYMR